MKLTHLMTAAAFTAMLGGAAYAQTAPAAPADQMAQPAAPATTDATTPPAASTDAATPPATNDSSTMSTTSGAANQYNYSSSTTQPASSSTLGDPTSMKAGDPNVVSNGPVPDTQENRAKYGKPMSNAGKRSKPAGN